MPTDHRGSTSIPDNHANITETIRMVDGRPFKVTRLPTVHPEVSGLGWHDVGGVNTDTLDDIENDHADNVGGTHSIRPNIPHKKRHDR